MVERIKRLFMDEEGATVVEYALLVGLVACALITAITGLRGGIEGMFTKATDTLNGKSTTTP